jgi:hypothetical protein
MNGGQQSWIESAAATKAHVGRDLFGAMSASGADAISFRNAADRASRLENPEEAIRLLDQAERTCDEVLAKEIAQRAYDTQTGSLFGGGTWGAVIEQYASSRSDVAEQLRALDAARVDDLKGNLQAAFGCRSRLVPRAALDSPGTGSDSTVHTSCWRDA